MGIIKTVQDWMALILICVTIITGIVVRTEGFWKWVARKTNKFCPNMVALDLTQRLSRASLGAMIYNVANAAIDQGWIYLRDREWLIENFDVYDEAKGNGKVKDAYLRSMEIADIRHHN
jgi:hypothetical protein